MDNLMSYVNVNSVTSDRMKKRNIDCDSLVTGFVDFEPCEIPALTSYPQSQERGSFAVILLERRKGNKAFLA